MDYRILALSAALFTSTISMAASDPMQAFPPAEAGFERKVIHLPQVDNPDLYRVQLLPGKMMEVDCNTRSMGGQLQKETAKGWGYDYWVLPEVKSGINTMMACSPNTPKTQKFVSIYSEELHRYNPRLPIVVYVPEGIELRYRIWSAKEASETAK